MSSSKNLAIEAGKTCSLWIATTPKTNYPPLSNNLEIDTLIVGSGIVGLTTALLLQEKGQKVAVLEAGRIVKDTTGHTTAKVTMLHGFIYQKLLVKYGFPGANAYAKANKEALEKIASIVEEKNIDCDFKRTTAYNYTENDKNLPEVEDELESLRKLGLGGFFTEKTPLPFPVKGAIGLKNQAQFHPRKYLLALAKEIVNKGGYIFENTRALNIIDKKKKNAVTTNQGEVSAKKVVIATHFPFFDKGFFYARIYPFRAYAAALQIEGEIPEGMYYSEDDNHHSIRNYSNSTKPLLMVGAGHHHTGQVKNTLSCYEDILKYANQRFNIKSIDYYWSTQDYHTMDSLPYIGKSPGSKKIYVACGMGSWGMTNGTVAAILISSAILGRPKPWGEIFNPSRVNFFKGWPTLLKENINAIKHYTKGLLSREMADLENLANGEGLITNIGGKKLAVYKDESGNLSAVSAVCPHMACLVSWNTAEKTWDCPCHGSRFKRDGEVIHGPALADLPKQQI